ncbi:MAG: Na+ dependent nucleoside transporter [Bacteroidetes bacterium]|nr:MAG: Na+ dependent nucleoside transporter [Bacteroidota bacterium]
MRKKIQLLSIQALIFSMIFLASCSSESEEIESVITKTWKLEQITDQETGETIEALEDEFLSILNTEENIFNLSFPALDLALSGSWTMVNDTLILLPELDDLALEIDSVMYEASKGDAFILFFHQGELIAQQSGDKLTGKERPMFFTVDELSEDDLIISDDKFTYNLKYVPAEITTFAFGITNIIRGLFGMIVLIGIAWIFSANRRAVSWKVVGIGLSIQVLIAFGILQVPAIQYFFEIVGSVFVGILDFTKAGTEFLFGGFLDTETYGFIFAFQVLPTIVFFSALTSLLFYLGIIQKIVYGLAWLMTKAMKLSGAESLSVAGNIFLGQTESPLMIKAYLPDMTKSEILLVMTGGMATLAGGVLAAYISFLGGDDPVQRLIFAKHLLAASIMAAPGAVVVTKILYPQTEEIDETMEISKDRIGSNVLDAISNGTGEGLRLAANVAAMLLVFIAFIAMFNFIVGWVGDWTNLNPRIAEITNGQYQQLSLQFILGYTFAPIMWLIGVSLPDITLVGRLLGEKIIMTEFIGYVSLAELKELNAFADPKSIIMATYMLCGFANFASIGIQIGGIGSLAPTRRVLLSQFGMRALLGGTLAGLMSATIVGMILG